MDHISTRIWHGHVTIKIIFHGHVYLLHARRNAYFPLYFSQIAAFFDTVANSHLQHKPLWLQHLHTPLHWNLPIGVLHDMFNSEKSSWSLSLHAPTMEQGYPAQILPLDEPKRQFSAIQNRNSFDDTIALQHVYMNSLKQANYVLSGNSRAVMRLSTGDTRVLWKAVVSNDYCDIQAIHKKLYPERLEPDSKSSVTFPLKIYLDRTTVVQAPCKGSTSLRQCLAPYINLQQAEVWIHGIRASQMYDLPVEKIWAHFHYLDMVVYVVASSMQAR